MSYLTSVGYVISHTRTTAMKKAIPGFLIKEMFDRFKTKALKTLSPDRSLWLYSVNEHALVSTLDALNLFDVTFKLNCILLLVAWASKINATFIYVFSIKCHHLVPVCIWSCINVVMNIMCKYFTGKVMTKF